MVGMLFLSSFGIRYISQKAFHLFLCSNTNFYLMLSHYVTYLFESFEELIHKTDWPDT